MNAKEALIGQKYLSPTRVPVRMEGEKDGKILLNVLVSGNTVSVDPNYQLSEYDPARIDKMSRALLDERTVKKDLKSTKKDKKETKTMDATKVVKKRPGISSVIDPLLFEGGRTVEEIVNVIKEKQPEFADGRNLKVNVNVRIHTLKKRGFRLETDDNKRVRLVK